MLLDKITLFVVMGYKAKNDFPEFNNLLYFLPILCQNL